MYEALRQRAPNSTRMTGIVTAMMLTAAAGYLLSNGFAKNIARMIEPATTVSIVDDQLTVADPLPPTLPDTNVDIGEPPLPPIPNWDFVQRKDDGITPPPGRIVDVGVLPPPPLPPAPVRRGPKLMPGPKPDYPVKEIRTQSQGVTELSVCVAANGRVTSASVASSSGHSGLDDAALKWVRTSRFSPGTVDGVARDVCGHTVTYEWSLKDAGQ